MQLIAYTGLRLGGALVLRWKSIDLDVGYLVTEASLVRSKEIRPAIDSPIGRPSPPLLSHIRSDRRFVLSTPFGTDGVLDQHRRSHCRAPKLEP